MHLAVTGGAGFIGSNLVKRALSAPEVESVTVLDDLSTGLIANLAGLPITFVEGSCADPVAVKTAIEGVDAVVHLAALPSVSRSIADPLASHSANATGSLIVLDQSVALGVQHVISASSSSVYGSNPALPKHEREWLRPMSPYAVSKLATEMYTLAYQDSFGLASMSFRFFNVYGPGQAADHAYAAVVPAFVDALLSGEPLIVHGDGLQSRDFTFVGTVCEVLIDAVLRRLTHPEAVNLAFGTRTTLLSLIDDLASVTGVEPEVRHVEPRAGDVRHSQADNALLQRLFPSVVPVTLPKGLLDTVDWFRAAALAK